MSYIPKSGTQQITFLFKYPEYDGRGIKIAIIDSAVDVSLTGLQKTSEGLSKIIDCFDFTEAGNVDTSVIREMGSENVLFGLSGQKFKIPTKWKNPSGKWHLGLKSLYKPILTRTKEVPEKFPEMDCIVWFNGEKWQACIETFGEDLEDAKILTNFRDEHEYGILPSNFSNLCYCITVHRDGDLLEIFQPYCKHGSIVAQIAAAHFPDKSHLDGLAPGAQIISMNVLDPEKGNRKTLLAVEKALLKCIEMKCDIVNYSIESIGGNSVIELLIEEMVKKHNILIFKCSGNSGPFYSTINKHDIRIRDYIFTIGAYITPEIQKFAYNMNVGNDYPTQIVSIFSSRGPDKNGNQGIDFIAHGTVSTDIPKFDSIENNKFISGTSFASPNAAGLIACLLSALKANFIEYSPEMIKFVLFKTAKLLEIGNKLEFGHGIIQINSAFNYCKTKMDPILTHLWSLKGTKPNIYILQRAKNESIRKFILEFSLLSKFMTDKTDAKWIFELSKKAKQFIELSKTDSEASISVKIDTTKLESGNLTFAEIYVLHPLNESIVFNIPVTVIVPLKINEANNDFIQKEITLFYNNTYHIFVDPFFENKKIWEIQITGLENFEETTLNIENRTHCDEDEDESNEKIFEFSCENCIHTYQISNGKKEIHEICISKILSYTGCPSPSKFKLEFYFKYEPKFENFLQK